MLDKGIVGQALRQGLCHGALVARVVAISGRHVLALLLVAGCLAGCGNPLPALDLPVWLQGTESWRRSAPPLTQGVVDILIGRTAKHYRAEQERLYYREFVVPSSHSLNDLIQAISADLKRSGRWVSASKPERGIKGETSVRWTGWWGGPLVLVYFSAQESLGEDAADFAFLLEPKSRFAPEPGVVPE